jgi:hypothetical protein
LNRAGRAPVAQRVAVVVVLLVVELVTPGVAPGAAPIELVLPVVPVDPLEPAVLEVSLPAAGGAGVVVTLFSVVVLDVLDDVDGVAVSSRLVQAPRETAATSAKAAHEVRDAFIRNSLRGTLYGDSKGAVHRPTAHSRHALPPGCRPQPQIFVGQT